MAGPPYTVAPLWNDQSTAPVIPSKANMVPFASIEPPNTTPLTVDTGPLTLVPFPVGFVIAELAICHLIAPVEESSAAQEPTVVDCPASGPEPPSVYGTPVSSLTW